MTERLPWFPFYPKQWLDWRVLRMTLEAQGAYLRILAHCWIDSEDQCSIQASPESIARVLGISKRRTEKILAEFFLDGDPIFLERDGRYFSKRLSEAKAEGDNLRRAKQKAGKAGAERRWGKRDGRMADPSSCDKPANAGALAKNGSLQGQEHKQRQTKGGGQDLASSEDLSDLDQRLLGLAREALIPNRREALLRYLRGWVAKHGEEEVLRVLALPGVRGSSVLEIEDTYFRGRRPEAVDAHSLVTSALSKKEPQ